ncbi:uncharacterized protein [Hyperolius riggenbachi]|uniref:uncharacterized protein n=1 Tax=Hyperolius riggenbachi TaxID=752182 RepID=UPI0035A39252
MGKPSSPTLQDQQLENGGMQETVWRSQEPAGQLPTLDDQQTGHGGFMLLTMEDQQLDIRVEQPTTWSSQEPAGQLPTLEVQQMDDVGIGLLTVENQQMGNGEGQPAIMEDLQLDVEGQRPPTFRHGEHAHNKEEEELFCPVTLRKIICWVVLGIAAIILVGLVTGLTKRNHAEIESTDKTITTEEFQTALLTTPLGNRYGDQGDCSLVVLNEKSVSFNESRRLCTINSYKLLREEDIEVYQHCIENNEDLWVDKDNYSRCHIYNPAHGFVPMGCDTQRWFMCLKTQNSQQKNNS